MNARNFPIPAAILAMILAAALTASAAERSGAEKHSVVSGGFHLRAGGLSVSYYPSRDRDDWHGYSAGTVFHKSHIAWTAHRQHYGAFPSYGYYVYQYTPGYSYPPVYYYYGSWPYIRGDRVVYVERPTVRYVEVPIAVNYDNHDYYLSAPSGGFVGRALSDIRQAWNTEDIGLIERHVSAEDKIAVYLKGEYSYSVGARDYLDMTRDAMRQVETVSFEFTRVNKRASDEAAAYGRHEYVNEEGDKKVVYVTYTLHKHGTNWIITEVGSSPEPY